MIPLLLFALLSLYLLLVCVQQRGTIEGQRHRIAALELDRLRLERDLAGMPTREEMITDLEEWYSHTVD